MEKITNEVLSSRKYAGVDEDVVTFISKQESSKYKKESEIIKAVKNKLHQVHGVFLPIEELKEMKDTDAEDLLRLHVSTRERLDFYEEFLEKIFGYAAKLLEKETIESCVDIGAGFNGIALWKYGYFKKRIKKYEAMDINYIATDALNNFFGRVGCLNAKAVTMGIFDDDFEVKADVCLMLKLLPILISQCSGKTENILKKIFEKIDAKIIAVSFPTKSLSGRNVGMESNYEKNIISKLPKNLTVTEKFVFENEVVYLLKAL